MDDKTVLQYRAELTLPHSTLTITSNDFEKLKNQVRGICKSENIQPNFDRTAVGTTVHITDDSGPLGQIVSYEVHPAMSVSQTVNARKQGQKAA